MTKKVVTLVLSLLLMAFCNIAFAGDIYPDHLNNDPNYILCDGQMGTAWYVVKDSLNVEQYDPPRYIVAVDIAQVNGADKLNTNISRVFTNRFFYNYALKEMYVFDTSKNTWRSLSPRGSRAETAISMPAGEIAFYLAYNMKFYGQFYGRYAPSFYERI